MIVKNFVTDFGAVGDGTTNDSPAVDKWLAWAQAQGTAAVELYMPPGQYHFAGSDALTDGLDNVTISGYGATVDSLYIGSRSLLQPDFAHSARIETVSAGATSIDLVSPADASEFSVGQWILVSGLGLQGGGDLGYPPNFQFFEYKQITNISGSVLTLASPLTNSYESTWPLVDDTGNVGDQGGPATIYALGPAFGAQQTYLGLEVTADTDGGAVFMSGGLSLVLDGMTFDGLGPAASVGQSIIIRNSYIGFNNEVDKLVSNLAYINDTGNALTVQSASITNLVIDGSTIGDLNGTAQNTTITDSTFEFVKAGPLGYGVGQSLIIANSSIPTPLLANKALDPSIMSFSNGTFRIATSSDDVHSVYAWAVPGHEYFFAYYDGGINKTDDSGHVTTFKILDVWQDATYTYVDTDLGPVLPTPTFNGGIPANEYVAYQAMEVTQTDSGPADFVSLIGAHAASAGTEVNHSPVVTIPDPIIKAAADQTFQLSDLFTATDQDGDALTYIVEDSTPGGGHFLLNGVEQPANQSFNLTAAQLAQTTFVPAVGSSDDLMVRASDGHTFSGWSTVHIDGPVNVNDAPNVLFSNQTIVAAPGQILQMSDLMSAALQDADVLDFVLYDFSPGGGHFVVNGEEQATVETIVTAAQLAQTTFVTAETGSDDLLTFTTDGQRISNITAFHIESSTNHAPSGWADLHII